VPIDARRTLRQTFDWRRQSNLAWRQRQHPYRSPQLLAASTGRASLRRGWLVVPAASLCTVHLLHVRSERPRCTKHLKAFRFIESKVVMRVVCTQLRLVRGGVPPEATRNLFPGSAYIYPQRMIDKPISRAGFAGSANLTTSFEAVLYNLFPLFQQRLIILPPL
jgi:hypothetical protein